MFSASRILAVVFSAVTLATAVAGQSKSFDGLLEKALAGDVDAQNEVGISYSEGRGVRPNQKKAVYWFRRSAEQGYAIGICNLALHYGMGWGVRRDKTLMMKYTFATHAIDGLKCNPADVIEAPPRFRPSQCDIERGWVLAITWLRAHPSFDDNFGNRPWMDDTGEYSVTVRENAPSFTLPPKLSGRCRPGRHPE